MAYYEHAPEYGAYILMMLCYFIFSWVIIVLGAYINREALIKNPSFGEIPHGKKVFLKKWAPWLLIGLLLWSFSTFKLTDYYLSTYSFEMTGTHFTASSLLEDMKSNERYRFDVEGIQKLGIPHYGLLKGYKLQDSVREGLITKRVGQIVILQGYPLVPVVKLYIYEVNGRQVKSLRTAYIFFPQSPGGRLSAIFNFPFEMFFWQAGGGPGA
ncbi:hypothetical protein [Thermococcus paralvinellae]|uniref:Uncharacterized protein n=1 Tax=Thermococcus paralvinellae TaxID=582419 RepID=W0I4K5_9EURY|nr:hypothetical protein [Thermococcus paralvinellae]AHF81021.1 Hypothetical protein TES1_1645 [Thermococcus paralvinellae]